MEKENLPLNDGDYFKYKRTGGGNVKQTLVVKLRMLPEDTFRFTESVITQHARDASIRDESIQGDYKIDLTGYILSFADPAKKFSSFGKEQVKDRLVKIWLPSGKQSIGEEVDFEGFPQPLIISDKIEWKGWSVWVAEYSGHKFYFEENTGYLVGKEWGKQKWVLVDTTISDIKK